MAEMRLAHTSGGVEMVAVLDEIALHSLATWLCADRCYHDIGPNPFGTTELGWNLEKRKNGGYCDCCRNFAGEILANFDLVRKEQP